MVGKIIREICNKISPGKYTANSIKKISNKYGITNQPIRGTKITMTTNLEPVLTSLIIPEKTRVHMGSDKKFRSELAYVEYSFIIKKQELVGNSVSLYTELFNYPTGQTIKPDKFTDTNYCLTNGACLNIYKGKFNTNYYCYSEDTTCTNGIHFFLDISDTINYYQKYFLPPE